LKIGFKAAILDDALFHNEDFSIMFHMHLDDGLVVGKSRQAILAFLANLKNVYLLKINERPKQHLGYTLNWRDDGLLYINQSDFAQKILDEFGMLDANPVKAPSPLNFQSLVASEADGINVTLMQKAIGMLTYLALHTRPDIAFTINVLAQFRSAPNMSHWSLVKHLLCYLCGTETFGIHFTKGSKSNTLCGGTNADYAALLVSKKSTSGYVITLFENPISWTTKKQSLVAQSTTEAEFIAINKCAKQLYWMSNLMTLLSIKIDVPIIFNNNSGAVFISKEPKLNPNTKHIKIWFQYIRQLMVGKVMKIQQVLTVDMIADVLTKSLGKIKLASAYKQLHLKNVHV
jgi:hypothetical protein